MSNKIIIKDVPFEELLRSAYEILKKEDGGVLFGEKTERKQGLLWVVESAHAFQLIERYPGSLGEACERASWGLLYEKLGEYHSHITTIIQRNNEKYINPARVALSVGDKYQLKENPQDIEVITGLREVSRAGKFSENPFLAKGHIRENGRIYRVDVGGYYYIPKIGFRRAKIEVSKRIRKLIR